MAAAHVRTTQAGVIVAGSTTTGVRITQSGLVVGTLLGGTTRVTMCGFIIATPQDANQVRITQCGYVYAVEEGAFPPPQDTYICPIDASMGPVQIGGN